MCVVLSWLLCDVVIRLLDHGKHIAQYTGRNAKSSPHSTQRSTKQDRHSTQYTSTVHSTQYTVHITQYTAHSTQYTVHRHSIQYSVHCTSTHYSTQYTLHSKLIVSQYCTLRTRKTTQCTVTRNSTQESNSRCNKCTLRGTHGTVLGTAYIYTVTHTCTRTTLSPDLCAALCRCNRKPRVGLCKRHACASTLRAAW